MKAKIKAHKKLVIVLAIVLIIVVAGVVGFFMWKKNAKPVETTDMVPQAFTLQKQDLSNAISTKGTVESANVTEVTTEVTSAIKELNVELGEHVEKGQVLCTFDGQSIQEQISELESQNNQSKKASDLAKQQAQRALATAQAQVQEKQAALEEANKTFASIKQLVENSGMSSDQMANATALTDAQNAVMSAQANLDAANDAVNEAQATVEDANAPVADSNKELAKLKKQLSQLTVVAEQSGIITQLNVSKGSIPNGTLMRIEDDKDLKVNVSIKEKDILKLSQGQKATIVSDAIGEEQQFKGEVDKVVNFATMVQGQDGAATGGYSATIKVEPGTPLLLGMNVRVDIMLVEGGDSLAVPYDAIIDEGDAQYVLLAKQNKDGKFKLSKVKVETGDSNDYYTAITSDKLKEGDTIMSFPEGMEDGQILDEVITPENEIMSEEEE